MPLMIKVGAHGAVPSSLEFPVSLGRPWDVGADPGALESMTRVGGNAPALKR